MGAGAQRRKEATRSCLRGDTVLCASRASVADAPQTAWLCRGRMARGGDTGVHFLLWQVVPQNL